MLQSGPEPVSESLVMLCNSHQSVKVSAVLSAASTYASCPFEFCKQSHGANCTCTMTAAHSLIAQAKNDTPAAYQTAVNESLHAIAPLTSQYPPMPPQLLTHLVSTIPADCIKCCCHSLQSWLCMDDSATYRKDGSCSTDDSCNHLHLLCQSPE